MNVIREETFGLMKPLLDAHTLGINAAESLLKDIGYHVVKACTEVEHALDSIMIEDSQKVLVEWIKKNNIKHLGVSYRLDSEDALKLVGQLVMVLKKNALYESAGAQILSIYFAGLKPSCDRIEKEFGGRIKTLRGGENIEETLEIMGIPKCDIPKHIIDGCKYDNELHKFGKELIGKGAYKYLRPMDHIFYKDFGTNKDTVIKRLKNNFLFGGWPLIRAHSGPYSADVPREECLRQFELWCKKLAEAGFLDVLSIGSSQLSQSNFGENWDNKRNGGGVPVNSELEYFRIWEASKPMLVRTYSSTKNIKKMAEMYDRTINMAWHALSLWWFNQLDGRGSNDLYDGLCEHIDTIKYIANSGKILETNVPHHFAFRGCDDVTYIVSAVLAAKLAKKNGIKNFILQNMLNTPRSTWGIQDLAKSRALLNIMRDLMEDDYNVILQTRAGLDYFKPDLDKAKIQLAAVTAMMDDIEPRNQYSPQIIHVVSYSEALYLATPEIINDSIKITLSALMEYRRLKQKGLTPNVMTDEIQIRTFNLERDARKIIKAMEDNIPDLYTPEGFYIAFVSGWLPVPGLWNTSNEYRMAREWETKLINGGIKLIDHEVVMNIDTKIDKCINNIPEANYLLKQRMKRKC